jgi:hypothetical protein
MCGRMSIRLNREALYKKVAFLGKGFIELSRVEAIVMLFW